ncbi:MAG: cytochrome c-type biogenesis protein [Gammaproteobacteria bacterium]|nr:cytochrome c-type biogenesis protein [Gammaproteobacteria bacterium]
MRAWLLAWALLLSSTSWAVIEVREFEDPEKQQLYEELVEELRCLVCQNQNLAASNADLAKDLRRQSYEMVERGAGKEEIIEYMVDRYGDFVLYRPPMKATTLLLWLGPVLFIAAGLAAVAVIARRRTDTVNALSDEERRRARKLLED